MKFSNIASLLLLCLVVTCQGKSIKALLDTEATTELVGGFVMGILQEDSDFASTQQCFSNVDQLSKDVVGLVKDFQSKKALQYKVEQGMKLAGSLMMDLPSHIKGCREMRHEVKQFTKLFTIWSRPAKAARVIGMNIMTNFFDIMGSVDDAKSQWKNKEFYEYGHTLGSLVVQVLKD